MVTRATEAFPSVTVSVNPLHLYQYIKKCLSINKVIIIIIIIIIISLLLVTGPFFLVLLLLKQWHYPPHGFKFQAAVLSMLCVMYLNY